MFKYFSTLLAFILIFGCTKQIEFIDAFDYKIIVNVNDQGFVLKEVPIEVEIVPEHVVDFVTYNLTYKIKKGEGKLKLKGFNKKVPDNNFDFDGLLQSFIYIPSSGGEHEIELSVIDYHGLEHTTTIFYTANFIDFGVDIFSEEKTIFIGASTNLSFEILEDLPSGTNYEMKFIFEQGKGILENQDSILTQNEWYPISIEKFNWIYHATEINNNQINFSIRNTHTKVVVDQVFQIETEEVDFQFEGHPEKNTIFAGEATALHFLLEEDEKSNTTYEIRYSIESGEGEVSTGGVLKTPYTWYPVSLGNFSWNFLATNKGNANIKMVVRNKTTKTEEEVSIRVDVQANGFELDLENITGDIDFNESAELIGSIDPKYFLDGTTYEGSFVLSGGKGTILYNGNTYGVGDKFPMDKDDFSFIYSPTVYESSNVSFKLKVEDNEGNKEEETIAIKIKQVTFDFTASENTSDGNVLTHEINNVLNVPGSSAGLIYKMSFSITGGNGKLKYNGIEYIQGQAFIVPAGNFNTTYIPSNNTKDEIHTLTIKIKDNTGQEKTHSLNVDVYQLPYLRVKEGIYGYDCGRPRGCKWRAAIAICNPDMAKCSSVDNTTQIDKIVVSFVGTKTYIQTFYSSDIRFSNGWTFVYVQPEFEEQSTVGRHTYDVQLFDRNGKASTIESATIKTAIAHP